MLEGARRIVTVREVVGETLTFRVRRTGKAEEARAWLEALLSSRVPAFDPPLRDVVGFVYENQRPGAMRVVDLALAHVALSEDIAAVAPADPEFARFSLLPLFAGT